MLTLGFAVFDDFQVMGMGALSAFETANPELGRQAYRVIVLSEQGGPVRNSPGFAIGTQPFGDGFSDTTVTIGSLYVKPSTPGPLAYLRAAAARSRRIAASAPVREVRLPRWPEAPPGLLVMGGLA